MGEGKGRRKRLWSSGIQQELCLGDHRAFTPVTWLALISLTCLPFPPFRHSTMVHSTVVRGAPTEEEAIQELAVITSTYYFMVLAVAGLSCSNLDLQPWMRHVGSSFGIFPPCCVGSSFRSTGFSCCRAWALEGSVVVAHGSL